MPELGSSCRDGKEMRKKKRKRVEIKMQRAREDKELIKGGGVLPAVCGAYRRCGRQMGRANKKE